MNETDYKKRIIDFYREFNVYELKEENYVDNTLNKNYFQISFYTDENLFPLTKYYIYVNLFDKCLCKFDVNYNVTFFYDEELKFFDFLNFEICDSCAEITKQNITDWFLNKNKNRLLSKKNNVNQLGFMTLYVDPTSGKQIKFEDLFKDLTKKHNIESYEFNRIFSRNVKFDMKDPNYVPNRITALSIVVGCELNLEESNEFLHKIGYHLSETIEYDQIIIESIENELDIDDTNKRLLKVFNEGSDFKTPARKYRYWNHLLGSPKAKEDAKKSVIHN